MNILDDSQKIIDFDKSYFMASIKSFPKQCLQTWGDLRLLAIPQSYKEIENVVLFGMGGSGLGLDIVDCVFSDQIKIPVEVFNTYFLPAYVGKKTLFVASSYSGTTEEINFSLEEALRKKAKVLGITTGGKLKELLEINKLPYFLINPLNNPCNQPRMGLGYSVAGILELLSKTGILEISSLEKEKIIEVLDKSEERYGIEVSLEKNSAKRAAMVIYGKVAVLVGAEFLAGSLHAFRNQFHENAKNFAEYFLIPELNHHLMEGLAFPKSNPQNLFFLFIESAFYHPLIQKRISITKEVVEKNKITVSSFKCQGKTKLAQAFETVHFSEYVNFYLSFLNKIDPSAIPWVDYFKKRLAE